MAEDLKNVRFSGAASAVADKIFESGLFEDRISISKFALAYAVKNHLDDISPDELDSKYDSLGSNYNIGSIDEDKFVSQLISSIYPETTTPYRYARVLMIYGLEQLGKLYDEGKLFPLNQWL